MAHDHPDDSMAAVTAVAALGDPVRRRLYHFVGAQDHAVSRDQAAEGVDISRSAAAFHLDRLVEDGLLVAEFRRLTGRRGPGAGRPAKLYRRAPGEITVSLPARRYELAAGLLAAAVEEAGSTGAPVETVLGRRAREWGERLAGTVRPPAGARATRAAWARAAADALAAEGYEPRSTTPEVVLANCPFHALVEERPELVCHMNLAMLEGLCEALPRAGLAAALRPTDEACCVRLIRGAP